MWFKTEAGKGSKFSFELEFRVEQLRKLEGTSAPVIPQKSKPRNELERLSILHRVLVVKDDQANHLLIGRILSGLDQEVVFTSDGRECLDALSEDSDFDAVLLDLRMPKVSGIEVLRRIRKREVGEKLTKIPIAIMPADVFPKKEAIGFGASEFVMKLIDFGKLRQFLTSIALPGRARANGSVIPFPTPRLAVTGIEPMRDAEEEGPIIMIAEDNAAVRKLMKKLLRKRGYRVGFASDGEECLRMLSTRHYDAVLSDLRMPGMDGLTFISRIREGAGGEDHRDTIIALMTAEMISEKTCIDASANALIPKPIPMEDLKRFLKTIPRDPEAVVLSG